jgi:hypothetical protein
VHAGAPPRPAIRNLLQWTENGPTTITVLSGGQHNLSGVAVDYFLKI